MRLRQPIVVVLGHVDHGKTTLLDSIRGTSVATREPGQITQWIGASMIPSATLTQICGHLLERFNFAIDVPGLLFIDTPGHETFSNLRMRGGSAADVAILVVDVTKGFEPQTIESISILRSRKTPFVVAANKIDLVRAWKSKSQSLIDNFRNQTEDSLRNLDAKVYDIVGLLSRYGFNGERFDRITDFKKTIAIVPVSGRTGEGIPELLAVLVGLTQAFMKERLSISLEEARGVVLEVAEETGLGTTLNAIVYDGALRVNDRLVLQGKQGTIYTTIRALLLPKPLDEIRDPRDRFSSLQEVGAAAGVKIVAPELDYALAGSPLYVVRENDDPEKYALLVREEVQSIVVSRNIIGVVVKADTLGSLEAISNSLAERQLPVRLTDIGDVSKRDVSEAAVVRQRDQSLGAILAFNVRVLRDAQDEIETTGVKIFQSDIVYHMLEEFQDWFSKTRAEATALELERLIRPAKVKILKGFVFRRSDPAIVGVEILAGRIRPKYPLADRTGTRTGQILRIQDAGKDIQEAVPPMQVAISIDRLVVGRHIHEGDTLYIDVPEAHMNIIMNKYREAVDPSELSLIKEILGRGRIVSEHEEI